MSLLLLGCGTNYDAPQLTPTSPNPAEIALTMMANEMNAKATQQMIGIQFTATAQVIEATRNVESTQAAISITEQARRDAQATDQQGRQDAQATEQRRRDDAATEQARKDAQSTAEQGRLDAINTQSAQATATWDAMTKTAVYPHATLTAIAVNQEMILATNDVEKSNLEVERQTTSNWFQAMTPYFSVIFILALVGVVLIRKSRVNEIANKETGVVEGVVIDNKKIAKPQLMTRPLLMLEDGKEEAVDPKEQSEVTRRAQGVEAFRVMPTQAPTPMAAGMMNNLFGGEPSAPRFQVLDANEIPPAKLLDEDALKKLDRDWREPDE